VRESHVLGSARVKTKWLSYSTPRRSKQVERSPIFGRFAILGNHSVLVIANGAAKSGSTWLYNIVDELVAFERPPSEYLLDEDNRNPEIQYDKLGIFLENLDYSSKDYLIKNHFNAPEERDLILSHAGVFVVDIERDLRDVVVSAYFHNLRESSFDGPFKKYYWQKGRWQADLVRSHHEAWKIAPKNRAYVSSYDRLKGDFTEEVRRIAKFLGRDISDIDAKRIGEATSIEKLRDKYDDKGDIKFFRKGVSGDWEDYFDRLMIRDIREIEMRGIDGLGVFAKNFPLIIKKLHDYRIL